MRNKYDVELKHVKLSDTSEAVNRVLAEKIAGRDQDGSVDLIWINGENFAKMKENQLLYGPLTETLPNFSLVDFENKPTTLLDFTIPVDGLEAPWGMAQFNFPYNADRIQIPPKSMSVCWLDKKNTGRFSYPAPPDFLGSTFLQQVLIETIENPDSLQQPIGIERFREASQPLWDYLEQFHPHLWRRGETFPSSRPALRQLLDDGQVDIAFLQSRRHLGSHYEWLLETTRFVLKAGTIGNTHLVAIPYNASNREGALLVANFLLSPDAQAHKQNPEIWGDGTVLDLNKLSAAQKKLFDDLPRGIATLSPEELGKTQPNPHPDWRILLDAEWQRRYAN